MIYLVKFLFQQHLWHKLKHVNVVLWNSQYCHYSQQPDLERLYLPVLTFISDKCPKVLARPLLYLIKIKRPNETPGHCMSVSPIPATIPSAKALTSVPKGA